MFTRVTESGGRRYLQIVESFRNDAGKPRLRVVANLGRVDGMKEGQLDALIRGLSRVAGRDEPAKTEIAWEGARSYGDVFALHALWKGDVAAERGRAAVLGEALVAGIAVHLQDAVEACEQPLGMRAGAARGVGEHDDAPCRAIGPSDNGACGSPPPQGRSSLAIAQRQPVLVLPRPGSSTGIVVSSM